METAYDFELKVVWEEGTIEDIVQQVSAHEVQSNELLQKVIRFYRKFYETVDVTGMLHTTDDREYIVLRITSVTGCTKHLLIGAIDVVEDSNEILKIAMKEIQNVGR